MIPAEAVTALLARYLYDPVFHARVEMYRQRRGLAGVTPETLRLVAAAPEWMYVP